MAQPKRRWSKARTHSKRSTWKLKRRWSKARTHSKRSTWKLETPRFAKCPNCGEPILPHTLCSNCGYYDGKQIVAKKED